MSMFKFRQTLLAHRKSSLSLIIIMYSVPPLICQPWDLANCWRIKGVGFTSVPISGQI